MMSSTLPTLHLQFVEKVRSAVEKDRRLAALLVGGSYIHGGFDEHSDLDFVVVVEEESYREVMASRSEFAGRIEGLLAAFTGEHVGEPRLLICLYGPPLIHVDLKFVTPSDLGRLVERPAVLFARGPRQIEARLDAAAIAWPDASPEWFEHRAWIWLHYGAAKLARGELFEAIGMLGFFREQVLGPMLHRRAARPQRGVRRIETLGRTCMEQLARTIPTLDAASVRTAFAVAADMYVELRADDPPDQTTRHMPELIRSYLDAGA
jgi:predicted nucleotidyltransferase